MNLPPRDRFEVRGIGCWCPPSMTLSQLRGMGHTPECTAARKGWELNMRHLEAMRSQRQEATVSTSQPTVSV